MKSVLITGACGGMGRAVVGELQEQGFRVFALDKAECDAGENIIPVTADITSEESIRNAYELISSRTDSLFAIIHFAGLYMLDSLVEMDSNSFRKILDVNLYGAFLVNKTSNHLFI